MMSALLSVVPLETEEVGECRPNNCNVGVGDVENRERGCKVRRIDRRDQVATGVERQGSRARDANRVMPVVVHHETVRRAIRDDRKRFGATAAARDQQTGVNTARQQNALRVGAAREHGVPA